MKPTQGRPTVGRKAHNLETGVRLAPLQPSSRLGPVMGSGEPGEYHMSRRGGAREGCGRGRGVKQVTPPDGGSSPPLATNVVPMFPGKESKVYDAPDGSRDSGEPRPVPATKEPGKVVAMADGDKHPLVTIWSYNSYQEAKVSIGDRYYRYVGVDQAIMKKVNGAVKHGANDLARRLLEQNASIIYRIEKDGTETEISERGFAPE